MATTGPGAIETHYIQSFKAGIEHAYQQWDTRFAHLFPRVTMNSEFEYFDRIGIAQEMQQDNTRYGLNPFTEIDHDRRRITFSHWDTGKAIDPKDLVRVATDPTNEYSRAMVGAAHRKLDDLALQTVFAPAYTGKDGSTVVNFTDGANAGKVTVGAVSKGTTNPITTTGRYVLQAGNYEGILVDSRYDGVGTSTFSGLTLEKLKAVRTTMLRLDSISQGEVLDCFIGTQQLEELLAIDKVINSDYAQIKALANGDVAQFMGFRFHLVEKLPFKDKASHRMRRVIVARPNSLKFAQAKGLEADMWKLPDRKNIPYIFMKMSFGGTRMWGEGLAEIECVDE